MSQTGTQSHTSQQFGSLRAQRGGGGYRPLIVMAAAAVVAVAGTAFGQGLEELRSEYPGVQTYDPHGRILTVWGQPMTAGETPREAAEEWVFWYGDVFGSTLDLEEFREVTLRNAPEGKERRVFMYRQTIDELPVVGSSFRVMTEGEPEGGSAQVTYVAGRVATRPAGGLAEPIVTSGAALTAAKSHGRGGELEKWSDPQLVAIYDDAPVGNGEARAVWQVSGAGGGEPWTFYVDAVTGAVVRDQSSIMNFADEVEGKATGFGTPGTAPDTFDETVNNCPNDPVGLDLADLLVTAYLEGTSTLVDSGFTGLTGLYALDVAPSTEVDVFAELVGPSWFVLDGTSGCDLATAFAPVAHAGNPVTSPESGVDLAFNPSPTVKGTAAVNAHVVMSKVSRWLDLEDDAVPDVPVIVHDGASCGAGFAKPGGIMCSTWEDGVITFGEGSTGCATPAYSTVIAHEYGHFLAWHLDVTQDQSAFNEGFADSLAVLVFDTEFLGEDFFGCGDHFRWPRQPSIAAQQVYPKCEPGSMDPPVCSMGRNFGIHCIGELLPAIWLDLQDELTPGIAQDLFLDWMMIAQTPAAYSCASGATGQGAGPNTLVEVLQVGGNQYAEEICDVFQGRLISYPGSPDPCADSASGRCYADCDGSGVLDFWDFLCFQNAFSAGDSHADCDGDGDLTFFDFLCFQNEFMAGCS